MTTLSQPADATGTIIAALAAEAGPRFHVQGVASRPWRSPTFTGQRHRLTFQALKGARTRGFGKRIEHAELFVPGHILADVHVQPLGRYRYAVDVVTVEDA